ncbi:RE1-silencing transcription factor isoform X2 [Theropithecus gelada]|uniref:RE1-silencing transcription factor isoform X2 n=1 Tax=Theropithecus gelada TaxID=9565 RepID=UPI000DC18424|nr:RE1-silencing transcription factor isoform X2 [Theropithecus gelada]
MATQVMGQSSGGGGLFTSSGNIGMALPNDMYDLHDLSKAELAAPQLIMLANVALTGEVNGSCCDYLVGEERQMAELMPVGDNNFSDSEEGEGLEESAEIKGEPHGLENMELRSLELSVVEPQPVFEASGAPEIYSSNKDLSPETPGAEDKGERPYKCELCPYSSSQKTHLTRHMRTHSGEKPFKCDQCSYVASNQHEVTRHARQVHNGPKPLNCPHCDYKTADRSNFKKHVELHVNPRQFNCPVCDYAASKKCNLQYHFKSKHPTCPNKTMDVSKVKLKKTKKREVDLPDITNEKTEIEQTKIKGDVAGKKNEKSVKAEKRDISKEKKPSNNVSMIQVTTRTRKSVTETKEMDVHTGSNSEKLSKTKKSKRKLEVDTHSLHDAVNDEESSTKKKKKVESKSKNNSQEVPKGDSKVEENKKQNTSLKKSTKKKTLKNKSSKKSSKPPQKEPVEKESAQMDPPQVEPAPTEAIQKGPVQVEPPPPIDPAQIEGAQIQPAHDKPVQMEVAQEGPAQKELLPPLEPAQMAGAQMVPAHMELPPPMETAQTEVAQMGPAPVEPAQMEVAEVEPAPMQVVQKEPVQMELSHPMEVVQKEPVQIELSSPMEVVQKEPVQIELSPPIEVVQNEPVQMEASPPMGVVQKEPDQREPPPREPPLHMESVSKKPPLRKDKKEKSNMQSERARKEQVLIEVGLVPVKDSRLLKESVSTEDLSPPSPPLPKENLREEASGDQKLLNIGEGNKEASLQKVGAEEADESLPGLAANINESTNVSSSGQNLNTPEGETLNGKHQTDTMVCEMKMDTDQNIRENLPGINSTVEEAVSPVLPPSAVEEHEAVSKTALASPPATMAVNESQEIDEDEGIHSHEGSDLSDNMSEGSDDSGLHGARPVPQESSRKNAKEGLAVKAAKGDFVCIFCDRSFRKGKDYSKHLNRHLVNVYYLEEAAQGQE